MNTGTVTLFFGLLASMLALLVLGLILALAARAFASEGSPAAAPATRFLAMIQPIAVELAALIAVTATLGSLYLSEVANFDPCRLCWVQRGFMYPSALLLVLAVIRRSSLLALVAGVMTAIGLPVSIFHRVEQAVGGFGDSNFCEPTNPCSGTWVEEFGFITIPTMAGVAFAGIAILVYVSNRS